MFLMLYNVMMTVTASDAHERFRCHTAPGDEFDGGGEQMNHEVVEKNAWLLGR